MADRWIERGGTPSYSHIRLNKAMRPQRLKLFRNGLAILVLLAVPAISASELKQETLNAWDDYLRTANLHMHRNLGTGDPFLWIEEKPGRSQRVRQGEILISPAREASLQKVHDGLIHDWIGAVFIPCVGINDVFAVVHDYNRYKDFYKPTVIESKLVSRTGEDYEFSLVELKSVLFEKIVLEGQFESHCAQLDGRHLYCISYSTRVQEIKDYGQPDSHKLRTDEGHGYIWRLYSLTKFEERDGGVYIEVEAIALSRDISGLLHWFTKLVVEHVSRASMSTILQRTREAVRSNIAARNRKNPKTCNFLQGDSSR